MNTTTWVRRTEPLYPGDTQHTHVLDVPTGKRGKPRPICNCDSARNRPPDKALYADEQTTLEEIDPDQLCPKSKAHYDKITRLLGAWSR